jgi:hypothetical protein
MIVSSQYQSDWEGARLVRNIGDEGGAPLPIYPTLGGEKEAKSSKH